MGVSTYSTANVRNGNLLTAVPVVSWQGLGPDMNFALVHNSAHVASGVNLSHTNGFNLGPGWQTSYSARLIFNSSTSTTVVHDDGRMDTYTKVSGAWVPPAGVHDVLTQHMTTPRWTLDFKDQSSLEFNTLGRLAKVRDANGHALELKRDNSYKLVKITDAAGRKLLFDYDGEGRLSKIIDLMAGGSYTYDYSFNGYCQTPPCSDSEGNDEPDGSRLTANRIWEIEYDNDGRVWKVIDPEEHSVQPEVVVTYDSEGRIATIEDKDGDAYEYAYDSTSDALDTVTDPDTLGTPYTQEFAYTCPPSARATIYTDRRGKDWTYVWNSSNTLTTFTNPEGDQQEYVFDSNMNLTSYKDGLDNEWTFTYDSKGNRLASFTPLMPNTGQNPTPKSTRTYDSYNNLTSLTDAEGNIVTIDYDTPSNTLPTLITMPADGEGNGELEIALSYYDSSTPEAEGQLEDVTMLEVRTGRDVLLSHFEYDVWGQVDYLAEGLTQEACPNCGPYMWAMTPTSDSGSALTSSEKFGGGASHMSSVAQGFPTGSQCAVTLGGFESSFQPEGFPDVPCDAVAMTPPSGGWSAAGADDYSAMGLLKHLEANVGSGDRTYDFTHDALGRALSAEITSTGEGDADFSREFEYDPEDAGSGGANGEITRTGPDGVTTTITLDDAGRTETLSRDGVTATYTYDDRGLVTQVAYGNGAHVEYEYDDDQRVIRIEHFDDTPETVLKMEYEYNDRDLPTLLTESDEAGEFAEVAFTYDDRGRLIGEARMVSSGPSPEYDLAYEYDQAGNRVMKTDALNEIETSYVYDVDDGGVFRSDNNRLMFYETWDTSGESSVLVSTTWTVYGDDAIEHDEREGNPAWIITENESDPGVYSATHFVYDLAQRVWLMIGETWEADDEDEDECPELYDIVWAREFRYDAARARYLNRELDPEELQEGQLVTLTETWTDYDGDSSYGDFTAEAGSPPTLTDLRSYESGVGMKDPIDQSSGVEYTHADLIGSTRGTTDSTGAPALGASASPVTYTAFGERLDGQDYLRYAYAGAYGYQAHDFPTGEGVAPIPFLHVGWRYYDPGTGRFLQRDPIGVFGGWNVYGYVQNSPVTSIDPQGQNSLVGGVLTGAVSAAELAELLGYGVVGSVAAYKVGQGLAILCASAADSITEAVTAEASTKVKGGVKITGTVVAAGVVHVLDVVFGKGGGIKHGPHWKGKPPWPKWPPWIQPPTPTP